MSSSKSTRQNIARRRWIVIRQWLMRHPCVDCGNSDPDVLTFDHPDGAVKYHVSLMKGKNSWSMGRLLDQLEICEVRCHNCHDKKNALRERELNPRIKDWIWEAEGMLAHD